MNIKKIITWIPLLAGIGATITIGILAFITYETKMGLWLMASFGSTVVVVFGYPENTFSQPKNVFFGHVIAALVGILFVTFLETSFITLAIAVGIAVMLMMAFNVTHPPAGGNPIIVMIGGVSFEYLFFPVIVGVITIIAMGIFYNRLILKRKYPIT